MKNTRWVVYSVLATALATGGYAVAGKLEPAKDGAAEARALLEIGHKLSFAKRPSAAEVDRRMGGVAAANAAPDAIDLACEADEQDYLVIDRQIVQPWAAAWRKGDAKALKSVISSAFKAPRFDAGAPVAVNTKAGVTEARWAPAAAETVGGDAAFAAMSAYLGQYREIADVNLETFEVSISETMRDAKTLAPNRADLLVNFDVRGVTKDGMRRNDRGALRASVSRTGNDWKLDGIALISAETVAAQKASFTDISNASGVAGLPVYLREEAIRRGGYAVAMADYDSDGHVDMYVGASGPGTLLKGDGKGNFKPVANNGLGGETLVKTAVFGDFFNSGRQDLLLVRFEPRTDDEVSEVVFYKNLGNGKFEKAENVKTSGSYGHAMPAAVADYNNDGLLDFYVGFPGAEDFTHVAGPRVGKAGLMVHGLFMNKGDGFDDSTLKAFGKDALSESAGRLYPHSSLAYDFDADGDMDIVVMDDRGRFSPLYQNDGKGNFVDVTRNVGVANADFGMSVATGDLDGDGILDMAMTNVNVLASRRLNRSCERNYGKTYARVADRGVRLYKGLGNGNFAEITGPAGLDWTGEGMAGVEFVDYNNDGQLDIYLVNGLWTGTARGQDLSSMFVRAWQRTDTHRINSESVSVDDTQLRESAHMMRILQHHKGDVVGTDTSITSRPSMAGFQRNRLYRNDGNGKFTEVGFAEGVDSSADGYIVALSDVNEDGRVDFVLRNADPGSKDVSFSPVQILRNDGTNAKSVRVKLDGIVSNGDGIGAHLTATIGGKTYTRHLVGNNGTAQSEKIVHFGLGDAAKIDTLTVRWPSGAVQTMSNVAAGLVNLREPAGKPMAAK